MENYASTSAQKAETNTYLYNINGISEENPATLYIHLERNVMVELILMFLIASYFSEF